METVIVKIHYTEEFYSTCAAHLYINILKKMPHVKKNYDLF